MKNTSREDLVEELNSYSKKSKEIRKQIDAIDYENRLSDVMQYEGKCFQEKNEMYKDNISCIFVYDINKESCNLMTLSLRYWKDNLSSYFSIEYNDTFNPKKWEDDNTNWIEITKEAYMEHYTQVQKRILLAIS